MHEQLEQILAARGVIERRAWPGLRGAIGGALGRGELERVLPGCYVEAGASADWRRRALAACAHFDDAVISGEAAAALVFWPRCPVIVVEVTRANAVSNAPGFRWHRSSVPPQWVMTVGRLRVTRPAWTAVDLCARLGGQVLDEALRTGVGLGDLWSAFHDLGPRPGAAARRALLTDSRDEPWSEGERLLHRLLRSAGLTGWRTNVAVCGFRLDVAWIRFKVAVEVDGYEFHSGRETFESDRLRDQQLQAQGWAVARVTWRQLDENPENVVATVRRILRRRGWACRN